MTTKTVSFYIEGRYFTNLVRGVMLEGRWQKATSMVMDSLTGITHEQAISVLRGDNEFVGSSKDDSFGMIEQIPSPEHKAYLKDLAYIYKKYFNHNGTFYEPYCLIQGWNNEDALDTVRKLDEGYWGLTALGLPSKVGYNGQTNDMMEVAKYRSCYYLDDSRNEVIYHQPPHVYGMRKVDENSICSWLSYPKSTTLAECVKDRHLPKRGAHFDEYVRKDKSDLYSYLDIVKTEREIAHVARENFNIDTSTNDVEKAIVKLTSDEPDEDTIRKDGLTVYLDELLEKVEKLETTTIEIDKTDIELPIVCLNALAESRANRDRDLYGGVPKKGEEIAFNPMALQLDFYCKDWTATFPSGVKMIGDNPYHTDLIALANHALGCEVQHIGYDTTDIDSAIFEYVYAVETLRKKGLSFNTLSNPKRVKSIVGTVYEYQEGMKLSKDMVLYIETAKPEYTVLLPKVKAMVTAVGGKMAHLAIIAREENCPMIQTTADLFTGMTVTLDFESGTLKST